MAGVGGPLGEVWAWLGVREGKGLQGEDTLHGDCGGGEGGGTGPGHPYIVGPALPSFRGAALHPHRPHPCRLPSASGACPKSTTARGPRPRSDGAGGLPASGRRWLVFASPGLALEGTTLQHDGRMGSALPTRVTCERSKPEGRLWVEAWGSLHSWLLLSQAPRPCC